VPVVQDVLLYSLKTLFGVDRMNALLPSLFSHKALRCLVGFTAQQVRQGVCQPGAATRQWLCPERPICPDTLAKNMVQLHVRDLEAWCKSVIWALAQDGVLAPKVTGIVDATDLKTTAPHEGCGQVTRRRKVTDKHGKVHEIEVTVYDFQLIVSIEAPTKKPLAATVVPIHEHEVLLTQALVTPARTNLTGHARLPKVVFDKRFLEGVDRWRLDQHGLLLVVPAKDHMVVTIDAQAQAVAGEGAHTVRHGQRWATRTERLETEVVGIVGLTTEDLYGTPEHGCRHHRRDFQPNLIIAVVVRKWNGHNYGPAGQTVFLTQAAVDQPLQPFDDDRRLIENCCSKESRQPWSLKHQPQHTARGVRVHVIFTLLRFALATAYRWQCEQTENGGEPVGWQRWRRQLQ
jgi:hypothetical protein